MQNTNIRRWCTEGSISKPPLLRTPRAAVARNISMIRGLHDAHRTQIVRDICARFTPGASHPRIRRKCCAHLPHEERATRDVTF
jgi:hypothetical protein